MPSDAKPNATSARKTHIWIAGLLCLAIAFSGCATMEDQDRTKAEGTALGAVTGAVIGGGLGALTGLMIGGGRTEDIIAGLVAGSIAGGLAGGVAGYQYGMMVAQRKAQYQSSEEFYLSQIQEIDQATEQMKAANQQLSKQVAALSKRRAELDRALAAGEIDRRSYQQELASIRSQAKELQNQAAPATELVNFQRAVLKDSQNSGTNPAIAQELRRAAAEQEKAYAPLEETLQKLAAVGAPTRG